MYFIRITDIIGLTYPVAGHRCIVTIHSQITLKAYHKR